MLGRLGKLFLHRTCHAHDECFFMSASLWQNVLFSTWWASKIGKKEACQWSGCFLFKNNPHISPRLLYLTMDTSYPVCIQMCPNHSVKNSSQNGLLIGKMPCRLFILWCHHCLEVSPRELIADTRDGPGFHGHCCWVLFSSSPVFQISVWTVWLVGL